MKEFGPEPVRVPVPEGEDWRYRALCANEDPELFFPTGTSGPAERQIEIAKAVCRRCVVQTDCLEWAIDTGQDFGVWGGTSEEERRALKRRANRTRFNASQNGKDIA